MVTTWEIGGFGELAEFRQLVRLLLRVLPDGAVWDGIVADRRLRRNGATPAQRDAFAGTVRWPAVREPAQDPVAELLGGDAVLLPERPWSP